MKQKEEKVVILELSEHDASKILALIKREMNQADKIWQPYWERQAKNIQQSIERINALRRKATRPGDSVNRQ